MCSNIFVRKDPEVQKRKIKMGEIERNWQPMKFYCSEIKLIYSTPIIYFLGMLQNRLDSLIGEEAPLFNEIT